MSRGSRWNVLLEELGSPGRVLSRRVPCSVSEDTQKQENHRGGAGSCRGGLTTPGSQPGSRQAFLSEPKQAELKDNTVPLFYSEETEAQRVSGCGQLGQQKGWAQTQDLGSPILCFPPAAYLLCLLTHKRIFQRLEFKICSPSGISGRCLCFVFSSVLKGSHLE